MATDVTTIPPKPACAYVRVGRRARRDSVEREVKCIVMIDCCRELE